MEEFADYSRVSRKRDKNSKANNPGQKYPRLLVSKVSSGNGN
jgi:hypothetical protein